MRFTLFSFLLVTLAAYVAAIDGLKSIIVSYPEGTDQSDVDDAMNAIVIAGGTITHEYNIIKGFAAEVPDDYFETVKTTSSQYGGVVEEDQMVSTNNI